MIEIPRCATCGRFEPMLVYTNDEGVSLPMCALCQEELNPVKWFVYPSGDIFYMTEDGELDGEPVFSGRFTDVWNWMVKHDPRMDEPHA